MSTPVLRIFSYLPNPRVWKAMIAASLCGIEVEVVGDKPAKLGEWLWDYDARALAPEERTQDSPFARQSRRGFSGTLYKTDAFLHAHPFGTVPAAFSPGGAVGVFESNSILRAVARAGADTLLIELRGCLGGIWTAGLLCWIIDSKDKPGIMREITARLHARGACTVQERKIVDFDQEPTYRGQKE